MISLRVLDIAAGLVLSFVRCFSKSNGEKEPGKLFEKKTFKDETMEKVGKN
jgi:hypothetical protein